MRIPKDTLVIEGLSHKYLREISECLQKIKEKKPLVRLTCEPLLITGRLLHPISQGFDTLSTNFVISEKSILLLGAFENRNNDSHQYDGLLICLRKAISSMSNFIRIYLLTKDAWGDITFLNLDDFSISSNECKNKRLKDCLSELQAYIL